MVIPLISHILLAKLPQIKIDTDKYGAKWIMTNATLLDSRFKDFTCLFRYYYPNNINMRYQN